MSKIIKKITVVATVLAILPTFAAYRMAVPLEADNGGRLPKGSISFDKNTDTENGEDTPSKNCIYDDSSYIEVMNQAQPNRGFEAGDAMFVVEGYVISYFSPSNNKVPKAGLSRGKEMETYEDSSYFEICSDDLYNYPPVNGVDQEYPDETPVDDHTGPDWTPECILNTSSDYAAINTTNNTRIFNSAQFGLTNFVSPRWFYVPDNYDPENPSSYIYFDKQESEGGPRVSGPNPDYTYAALCRVKKMEL